MPFTRTRYGGDICAIFVHAGAGYHSVNNEKHHLSACNDAARVGMAILKNGGGAVEAVEMAIRLLEDREITNAGYGSNLSIAGEVECDACAVDYLGRSGAVGAITNVKNPITVARLVLDASVEPLSLSRVPPNLLVGPGASDFAYDYGINLLPSEMLVSDGARVRWQNWKQDIIKAEEEDKKRAVPKYRSAPKRPATNSRNPTPPITPQEPTQQHPMPHNISKHANLNGSTGNNTGKVANGFDKDEEEGSDPRLDAILSERKRPRTDGSIDDISTVSLENMKLTSNKSTSRKPEEDRQDHITDTVGAIAIDCLGRIAAASSSGGIGMKHRGRCGPAALVGISTAVIPADPDDPNQATVATVTSGTGEHMATSAAAHTAADRVLSCVRKERGQLLPCNEDEAMYYMIQNDFMRHPGVQNTPCQGAIGILCVKKMKHGVYFYFAHNTDSFAIASMHSDERKPVCVMSRSKESGLIAQGARKARARGARSH